MDKCSKTPPGILPFVFRCMRNIIGYSRIGSFRESINSPSLSVTAFRESAVGKFGLPTFIYLFFWLVFGSSFFAGQRKQISFPFFFFFFNFPLNLQMWLGTQLQPNNNLKAWWDVWRECCFCCVLCKCIMAVTGKPGFSTTLCHV